MRCPEWKHTSNGSATRGWRSQSAYWICFLYRKNSFSRWGNQQSSGLGGNRHASSQSASCDCKLIYHRQLKQMSKRLLVSLKSNSNYLCNTYSVCLSSLANRRLCALVYVLRFFLTLLKTFCMNSPLGVQSFYTSAPQATVIVFIVSLLLSPPFSKAVKSRAVTKCCTSSLLLHFPFYDTSQHRLFPIVIGIINQWGRSLELNSTWRR